MPLFALRRCSINSKVSPVARKSRAILVSSGAGGGVWWVCGETCSSLCSGAALVKIAGDPKRVVTITDFAAAKELGVRSNIEEGTTMRYDVLGEFAQLAAAGNFTVPIACTYALEDWRAALDVSQSQKAHGKLVLQPGPAFGS